MPLPIYLDSFHFSDPHFCFVFDRWRRVSESGVAVDFRPILKRRPGHSCFKDSLFDITELEEESVLLETDRSSSRFYRMRRDGSLIIVKSISLSDSISESQIESEIANLVSLRHPLITSPLEFAESTAPRRLKIARPYAAGGSLAEVLSDAPAWWTPTAKAKAIAGIALGLRFAHGLELLHGGLKASNVLLDADRRIQIADFNPIRLETGDAEPLSGEGWSPGFENQIGEAGHRVPGTEGTAREGGGRSISIHSFDEIRQRRLTNSPDRRTIAWRYKPRPVRYFLTQRTDPPLEAYNSKTNNDLFSCRLRSFFTTIRENGQVEVSTNT
jgi:serine/threonine protein kinase